MADHDKRAARRRARERPVPAIDHEAHCRALATFLAGAVAGSAVVVVYDAMADEVDLGLLLATAPEPGARFALTRTPDDGHDLTVHPVGGPTERHRYGYRQPRLDGPRIDDASIGAVLVPGLAFDRWGRRLGRGGGYYDRFLARLAPTVLRIGICASAPVESVPVDDHDVAMTHLSTGGRVLVVPLSPAGLSGG